MTETLLRLTQATTRFLLLKKLFNFCRSAFSLCKSAFSKTLGAFIAMDELFSSEEDDHLYGIELNPARKRPLPSHFDRDDEDEDRQKLYLVPCRWWKEVQNPIVDQVGGILYTVSSYMDKTESEIVLDMRKEEDSRARESMEVGVSGREYALLQEPMWLRTLKWHNDSNVVVKDPGGTFVGENYIQVVFPLQIRLSASPMPKILIVKICEKDNEFEHFRKACIILGPQSDMLHIWDFSGRTNQFFKNDRIVLPSISGVKTSGEIFLELNVHAFSVSTEEKNMDKVGKPRVENALSRDLVRMNGHITSVDYPVSSSRCGGVFTVGLTGLQNLGNTCFMNSAIQCLVHTPQLVDYFLGDYKNDIDHKNPLGLKGELALSFGELLRKLWAPGMIPVAPRLFKLKLANFAPQFSGYNQHDSQEFLAFLLDGLHEDLNRVKCKPYIETKDSEGLPDEEVAEEYWRNHLARNDSIIVDTCQGQYRSTLVCPVCGKVSVAFDPFMHLTLPLPSTTMRTMTLTVFGHDGITLPSQFTVSVPMSGRLGDLIHALTAVCSLQEDETILVAEIYKNKIFRFLDDPTDSLALIRDDDKLVAYRLPKDTDGSPLVVFLHFQGERMLGDSKLFGVPLVARMPGALTGSDICNQFLQLLDPFLVPADDVVNNCNNDIDALTMGEGSSMMEDNQSSLVSVCDLGSDCGRGDDPCSSTGFKFYMVKGAFQAESEIKMNEPVIVSGYTNKLDVHVYWSDKMVKEYDTSILSSLPEVFKSQLFARKSQESVSLYKCLEGFLQEEPLGPDDMWFCPRCKKPQQANKKLDLWRLPQVLIIHLKRFSYSQFFKNKLETYVDFPINDFDLSNYISHKNGPSSNRYMLYAISNHYGGMGGGHYTAFVDHGHRRWYEFDDSNVMPIDEDSIKTSAAYVLFYRRVEDD